MWEVFYNTRLFSSIEEMASGEQYMAQVMHDGNVTWIPQLIMETACGIDVTMFPRDVQTCTIKVGTRMFHPYLLVRKISAQPFTHINSSMKNDESRELFHEATFMKIYEKHRAMKFTS